VTGKVSQVGKHKASIMEALACNQYSDHNNNASQEVPISIAEPENSTTTVLQNQASIFMRYVAFYMNAIKALISFITRVWIGYTVMMGIAIFIKRISHNFGGDISPTLVYKITAGKNYRSPVDVTDGIPALFGKVLDQPIKAKIIHIDRSESDFCSPYHDNRTLKNESFALVPRGGCLFERKVHFIQEAGFAGAIIYNSLGLNDLPIRMASIYSKSSINITCMYLTHSSQIRLKTFVDQEVVISPKDWYLIPTGSSMKEAIYEFIRVSAQLWQFSFLFLLACFIFCYIFYNLFSPGSFQFMECIQWSTHFLLDQDCSYSVPKLITIPFPKRILTREDISGPNLGTSKTSYSNSCCAICIDDFQENDIVRDLPCGHVYHSQW
jgi:hypothetical protein